MGLRIPRLLVILDPCLVYCISQLWSVKRWENSLSQVGRFMLLLLSLSQKMAFAAEPLSVNASSSPVFGENSIFCHKMVRNGSWIIGIKNLQDLFTERYTLTDLTNFPPESLQCVEQAARDWIDNIPKQTHLEVLLPSSVLPKLSEFQPFHSTSVIKPAMTVVTCGTRLPILTVEVLSKTYELTVKKALIKQYCILWVHNTIVGSCVGFVFPRNMEESCVKLRLSLSTSISHTFLSLSVSKM